MFRGALSGLAFAVLFASFIDLPAADAESSLNRPPVAAPTVSIGVSSLPVLRSQTENVEDFVAGLIPGLMTNYHRVEGVAFIAVRDDHVVVRKDFGRAASDKPFDVGSLSDLLASVAIMQQIEQAKILATESIGSNVTLEQALTHQAGTPQLLADTVARISGQVFPAYLAAHVFLPLRMTQSGYDNGALRTSVPDMGQLMIALVNGGAVGQGRILQPATVDLMERSHVEPHPALPGFTFGFAEVRRNGWRALAHDGEGEGVQMRVVLVPEVHFGYFVLVRGSANAAFWRMLDNAVFDRGFPTHGETEAGISGAPAPNAATAKAVSGLYGPASNAATNAVPLKTAWTRITVDARGDGALILSGAENAVLTPREGGFWSAGDGKLNAAVRDSTLILSSGQYRPLALWLRWDIYLMAAFASAFAALGAFTIQPRGRRASAAPSNFVLMGGTAAVAFGIVSLLLWLQPAV